jgi:signal transduction histidine kinase
MVRINVTDFGIGIKEEDQRKIFTKFSRLDSPLTRKTEGTGLGLYISYSLSKLLGGDLKVKSGDGKTSFYLYLPTEAHKGGVVWWD